MMRIARGVCEAVFLLTLGLTWISSQALAQSSPTRLEQKDPSIAYSAGWAQDTSRSCSGGTAAVSTAPGALATFTFSGPSVRWIGGRAPWSGIANVLLDGGLVAEVDTYSKTEEIRVPMFTLNGLASSTHTLTIQVTGRMNPGATSTY